MAREHSKQIQTLWNISLKVSSGPERCAILDVLFRLMPMSSSTVLARVVPLRRALLQ